MTNEELRMSLEPGLMILGLIASRTKTKKDDAAVKVLKHILDSDEILDGIRELLAKDGVIKTV